MVSNESVETLVGEVEAVFSRARRLSAELDPAWSASMLPSFAIVEGFVARVRAGERNAAVLDELRAMGVQLGKVLDLLEESMAASKPPRPLVN